MTVRIKAADATKEHKETLSQFQQLRVPGCFFAVPFGVYTLMDLFPLGIKMFLVI